LPRKKRDLDGAIADYNRAIELDPKFAAAYFHRGIAKQAKGDLKAAIGDINGAIERNDQDFYTRLFLWLMRSRLAKDTRQTRNSPLFSTNTGTQHRKSGPQRSLATS
jgi:tetratricopeptide (TPR) repeat protein